MIILMLFAFIAGLVTILSPCILPILPIVLSGSLTGGKRKPLGIVTGFVGSFTFFTLFLSTLVNLFKISPDALRVFSILVIFSFGLSLLIPQVQTLLEVFFSKVSNRLSPTQQKDGFLAGVVVGLSLGLLWTPCVGPILASVISLALTGSVTTTAFFITLSYSLGTALPMLLITYTGRGLFQKVPGLLAHTKHIQQGFGVVMMLTAIALMFNIDRRFQVWVLQTFPNYGAGLTSFEQNATVQSQLEKLDTGKSGNEIKEMTGKPSYEMLADLGKAPEFIPGGKWFNLPEGKTDLTMKELRGKVVLVDFWTYSCINCIRTFPYLKDWYQKYADKGFVIVGVHSPEFEFEKNPNNVERAMKDFGISYPVVQDNNFATWRAYGGNTWPRHYLIDKEGIVREFHSGEGKYAETELLIQQLIADMGNSVSDIPVNREMYQINTQSPETYLGFLRMEGLASPEQIKENTAVTFSAPERLGLNDFSFNGQWLVSEEYAAPSKSAELQFHFKSQNVFLVMRPKDAKTTSKVKVLLDGSVVKSDEVETDVDANGFVTVDEDRLYTLIRLDRLKEHTIKLIFEDDNVEVFAFTFG